MLWALTNAFSSGKSQSIDDKQLSWLFDKMKKPRVDQIKKDLNELKAKNRVHETRQLRNQIKELKKDLAEAETHVDMETGLNVIEVPLNHTGSSAQLVA